LAPLPQETIPQNNCVQSFKLNIGMQFPHDVNIAPKQAKNWPKTAQN